MKLFGIMYLSHGLMPHFFGSSSPFPLMDPNSHVCMVMPFIRHGSLDLWLTSSSRWANYITLLEVKDWTKNHIRLCSWKGRHFLPCRTEKRENQSTEKEREWGRHTKMHRNEGERESVNLVSSYLPIDWLHPCPWAYATACMHIQILFFSLKLTKVTFSFYNSK